MNESGSLHQPGSQHRPGLLGAWDNPPAGYGAPLCTPRPALPALGPGLPDSRQQEKQLVRKPKGVSGLQVGGRKHVLKIQQRLHGPRRWLSRWRVSVATWAPTDGTRGSPLRAPSPGLWEGDNREGMVGCKWEGGSQSMGVQVCCALGHRLWDRRGQSGVSLGGFAASLSSGCSPGPWGTSSVVWVLEGDEGKPRHMADAPGERSTQLQTTATTQPGWRAPSQGRALEAGMLQLPPASLCPGPASCTPAMLGGPSSILPALEMPTGEG